MGGVTGRVFLIGLLAVASLAPSLRANPKLHTAENSQFEIVGLHGRSVSYVQDLSQHLVKVAERYLEREALQFPQRILVSLKPEDYVDFEGSYRVRTGERGFVNLDIRWEEPLSLRTTCLALSEALVVRYSLYNHGPSGLEFLTEWPVAAIGTKAYLSLRPAESRRLSDWLAPGATPTVASLLKRGWREDVDDVNGFAFLLVMEESGLGRKQIRRLMAQSIAGMDISGALGGMLALGEPGAESLSPDQWWRASLVRLLQPPEEPMETMQVSRLWIEALSDLSNTEFAQLNLGEVWEERDNEVLRDLIEARYEILRLRIVRVNPAYFNAARSLGALFESFLGGQKRHKYIHRLSAFLGDFEDSKELEEVVAEALVQGGPEGDGQ